MTRGPHVRAVEDTLRAWAQLGHLVGPGHAATRKVLRSAAQVCDDATTTGSYGERTMAARTLDELLHRHRPDAPPDETTDPWTELAHLIGDPPLRDPANP